MNNTPTASPAARRLRAFQRRGQTMVLGVVSLLVLALIVFITFNVTVSVQQKVKLQNYADAKAFSMAVAEARTLNYFAYTNRAIASAYVGMSNVHAYMSEAAILSDLKFAGMVIMAGIIPQEISQCMCCLGGPCCAQHCWHATEAGINTAGLAIDYFSGVMGGKVQALDGPASQTMSALNTHITTISGSQDLAKASIVALLGGGEMGQLKAQNMMKADFVTNDDNLVAAQNLMKWNDVFYDNKTIKQRIMAETVNASRSDFSWSRHGSLGATLFPPPWIADRMKASLWSGPKGNWVITQVPANPFLAGGRSGFAEGGFNNMLAAIAGDVSSSNNTGRSLSSFDWATIAGNWRHGGGGFMLPLAAPAFNSGLTTGNNGNSHTGGFLADATGNSPHNGSNHNLNLDMARFTEFNIGANYPFNQPAVYAAVTTDSRVNEYGRRGPWEINKNQSGVVTLKGVGGTDGRLAIANNETTKAFSKAQVYYHRIGDWGDYPNLFNPFWRAKLEPLTQTEVLTVLGPFDSDAAQVATGARAVNSSAVNMQ
ncbi:MAG TPA: hypothetical protein VF815_13930 [Myxococcaceae bacterium]